MEALKELTSDRTYFLSRFLLLTAGALFNAAAVSIFLAPTNIAPGGLTGIAIILKQVIGTPIGLIIFLGNIPILILGYKMLGGAKSVLMTVYSVLLFSVSLEVIASLALFEQVTQDQIINAIFGGGIAGLGTGLIYRAGGTMGGTSTLGRILRQRMGISLTTASLYTDTLVLAVAGLVFGWEAAMYAAVALFVNRSMSNYIITGPSETSTFIIVTENRSKILQAVTEQMRRGVTFWKISGEPSDTKNSLVMITVLQSEVYSLKRLLRMIDPQAFVTLLQGQTTYGKGFSPIESHVPLKLDEVEDNKYDFDMDQIHEYQEKEYEA